MFLFVFILCLTWSLVKSHYRILPYSAMTFHSAFPPPIMIAEPMLSSPASFINTVSLV